MMDGSHLTFEDHSFDVVFSYDAFEHFSDPASVMREIYRFVNREVVFIWNLAHYLCRQWIAAYRQITVPYCQHLFSEQTLHGFLAEENLELLDFENCNGWSLVQFRDLFDFYSTRLSKEIYVETNNYVHLKLIEEYASVIKNKTDYFDNLFCDSIRVLFKKK